MMMRNFPARPMAVLNKTRQYRIFFYMRVPCKVARIVCEASFSNDVGSGVGDDAVIGADVMLT